jgi:hypothetical protein
MSRLVWHVNINYYVTQDRKSRIKHLLPLRLRDTLANEFTDAQEMGGRQVLPEFCSHRLRYKP